MTSQDFKYVADLLKHAAGHSGDGIDACDDRNVDQLCAALIWAHTAICDAMSYVTEATRRKQNDSNAEGSGVDAVS